MGIAIVRRMSPFLIVAALASSPAPAADSEQATSFPAPVFRESVEEPEGPGGTRNVQVELRVVDASGQLLHSRVHVRTSQGLWYPGYADSALMSHRDTWMGGYFYPDGPVSLSVPGGVTTIIAGRGMEWRPVRIHPDIRGDTTITITLTRAFELPERRWYGGDVHIHSTHPPVEYEVPPWKMRRVAMAEDLAMSWVLDQHSNFTGAPHVLSTPDHILYYTVEYRNQAYGHVPLLGLRNIFALGCCTPPYPATPMLGDFRDTWAPAADQAMVLTHPRSTYDFYHDSGWPGWGLGREAPVLATRGDLDAYDIASYSNVGGVRVEDWYRLLNCGLRIPPSAGTDAMVHWYWRAPAGGYRVYVREAPGGHTAAGWVEGLRAGRVFVTNFPLIPIFTVDGEEAGSVIERSGPETTVVVRFRVESVLPVGLASLLRNGQVETHFALPGGPDGTVREIEAEVTLTESSWLAVRVTGTTDLPFAVRSGLFAHTGAVYVHLDGEPARRTEDAARFIDWIDSLQVFVEARGNWPNPQTRAHVLGRLAGSQDYYRSLFRIPPGEFALSAPQEWDTLTAGEPFEFEWEHARDPEAGDRVTYRLMIAADSLFFGGYLSPPLDENRIVLSNLSLRPNAVYLWRVRAEDLGRNVTLSTPDARWLYYRSAPQASVAEQIPADTDRPALRVSPNPSRGVVRLEYTARAPVSIEITDVNGRIVRRLRSTEPSSGDRRVVWDGLDARGRAVPTGVYWAQCRADAGRTARAMIVRG